MLHKIIKRCESQADSYVFFMSHLYDKVRVQQALLHKQ